jgi:hypothetical protein
MCAQHASGEATEDSSVGNTNHAIGFEGLGPIIDAALSGVLPADPAADHARKFISGQIARMFGEALAEAVAAEGVKYVLQEVSTVTKKIPSMTGAELEGIAATVKTAEDVAALCRYQLWAILKAAEQFARTIADGGGVGILAGVLSRWPTVSRFMADVPTHEAATAIMIANTTTGRRKIGTVEEIAGALVDGYETVKYEKAKYEAAGVKV